MPTIGIRIVHAGNNSRPGHMYTVFKGDDGSVTTFGHYPKTNADGIMGGFGEVRVNDDRRDHEFMAGPPGTNGVPNVARDFPVSPTDYQRALDYARDAASQAGNAKKPWGSYHPLYNSCVDFTWNVMKEGGLDKSKWFEGYPLPGWNADPLSDRYFDYFRQPQFNRGCLNFCVRGAERLVHGGGRRLRQTTDAVGKSVSS